MAQTKKGFFASIRDNYFLKAFFWGFGLASAVFLPFMLVDGGRFIFYGDFNAQQIPFYRLAHDAIRNGEFGWSPLTDLGANFIGSYSFYLLGSPFFWLTIPLPSEWVQYAMGPLLILKFACASLTAYVYLHRYTKTRDAALVGSLLYAFSGFSVYNIFFNHFHEAIITFPLLLTALDEYMINRRRGLFALAVAFSCLVNYYFFVGQVMFVIIYFFIRLFSGSWKRISIPDFLLLALESLIGVGISGILLLPSVLAVIQNPRVDDPINGYNALLYSKSQRYLHIIECFFFPPDLPARPNFTPDSDAKWASLGAWLPLFSMTGVLGWMTLRRKNWLKRLLWVLFVMALVPLFNSVFQLFNSMYYARWFYMLVLMMCLATVLSLETPGINWRGAFKATFWVTAAITVLVGFMPSITEEDGERSVTFGLEQYPTRFWTYAAIAAISLAALCYIFHFCRENRKVFYRAVKVGVSLIAVFYSIYFIALGKTQADYTWDQIIPYALNGGKEVNLPDLKNSRSDFYESPDNSGMYWEIPTIQAFHSIVPGSVMEFYESIGVQRDVGSRPDTSHYALRGLTSVRWLFDENNDEEFFAGEDDSSPAMPGFAYYGNLNGFDVWENMYYIPMGFSYDYYIPRSEYDNLSQATREKLMLRAVVIEDLFVSDWGPYLEHLPEEDRTFTEVSYIGDCLDRSSTSCEYFSYVKNGFEAMTSGDKERIMFFSVPYEPGWRAQVNGQDVPIYRANVGFMAVKVPAGEDVSIRFTYRTPGLFAGIGMTGFSSGILIAYMILVQKIKKRPSNPAPDGGRLKLGRFSDYLKRRSASFNREGAMRPVKHEFAVAPENPPPERQRRGIHFRRGEKKQAATQSGMPEDAAPPPANNDNG